VFSDSNPVINKIRYYSSFVMAAIYLVIGLLFLFSDIAIQTFPEYRKPVGLVLIAYAAFRTYSTITKLKQQE
jgi:hypothetical protein